MIKQFTSQINLYKQLFSLLNDSSKKKITNLLLLSPLMAICELSGLIIIYFVSNSFVGAIENGNIADISTRNVILFSSASIFMLFIAMKIRLSYLNQVAKSINIILEPIINTIFRKAYLTDWPNKNLNDAKVITSIIVSKSREVALLSIYTLFTAVLALFNLVFIVSGMVIYAPILSAVSILITIFFYLLIANKSLKEYDKLSESSNQILSELTNICIRSKDNADVDFVNNTSPKILKKMQNSFGSYIKSVSRSAYLQGLPRTVMESYGFCFLITLFALPLIIDNDTFINGLVKSSIIAVCFYKILPAIQAIYKNYGQMRYNSSELKEIINIYKDAKINLAKSLRNKCVINKDIKLEKLLNKKKLNLPNKNFNNIKFSEIKLPNNLSKIKIPILKKGELLLFKGKSGSGKTTLINKLNFLIPDKDIEIIYKTSNLKMINSKHYQKIYEETIAKSKFIYYSCRSTKYQIEDINENDYIFNLKILFKDDSSICNKLISENYEKSLLRPLSTGQLNRLHLCYLLASHKASFIFLDEPTANLDYKSSINLSQLIKKYLGSKCFIIASHDRIFDKISTSIISL